MLPQVGICQEVDRLYYDIGAPTLTEIWVDPISGDDSRSGINRTSAIKTVQEAWRRVPSGNLSSTGYKILLTAGIYPRESLPNYWEAKRGTAQFPIIIQGVDGPRAAVFQGDINGFDLRHFYLLDFSIAPVPAGDALHLEQVQHVLLRGMELNGGAREAHETIKINQSQHLYIEDSNIHGSYENAIDFVAVQYGHIRRNRIHDAADWCIYLKGGSAYFTIEGNEISNCGTGGFTAGQGTGFEYMTSPWLHFEAYDLKFINNIVHHTEGAGFGVNGGYNILLAHNTLYHVGTRSHAIEVVFGSRSCDESALRCGANLAAGGWGTAAVLSAEEPIPNRNIYIYNNLVFNPTGVQSQYQHLAIYGPRIPSSGSNLSSPVRTDTNLQIRGNLLANGPADMPLGIEDTSEGCQPDNPTCSEAQLRSENSINLVIPQLLNPEAGDYRPVTGGSVYGVEAFSIPSFSGTDREPMPIAPSGVLENVILRDYQGTARNSLRPVGAFAGPLREPGPAVGYLPWNSFLGMTNIVELVNSEEIERVVTLTVFDISGQSIAQSRVGLPGRAQRDIILNGFGQFPRNSYGLVTLDYEGSGIRSRIAFYRQQSSGDFDIAYSIPGASSLSGRSFVGFNTFHPSRAPAEAAAPVANWLSIINVESSGARGFEIRRYSGEGQLLFSRRVTAPAFGRIDLDGGHEIPGANSVGFDEIIPDDSAAPYYAFNTRYGSAQQAERFAFAFPLFADGAGTQEQFVNVSTGGEATNWLEVTNTTSNHTRARISLYDRDGVLLGETSVALAPRAQAHLYLNTALGFANTGVARVVSEQAAELRVQSMFYFFKADQRVAAMYGVQAQRLGTAPLVGSYNLFLEMNNWLKISNSTASPQSVTLRVYTHDGSTHQESFSIAPYATRELGLHEAQFGTSANSYGQIRVEGTNLTTELLRTRVGTDGFDFVFPTQMQ